MAFLPFGFIPSHWGLKGKERDIARAHHELAGEALERRLLELEYEGKLTKEQQKQMKLDRLDIDLKYGNIEDDEYHEQRISLLFKKGSDEYQQAMLEVQNDLGNIDDYEFDVGIIGIQHKDKESTEYLIAMANLDLAYDKITELEYERAIADAKGEAWVKVLKADLVTIEDGETQLTFELDWNTRFVEELIAKGWTGFSQEEIVDQWFTHTCQSSMNSEEYLLQDGDQE